MQVITLKPISVPEVDAYKATRLRALQDTPTAFGSTYAKESQLTDADWQRRVLQWNSEHSVCYLAWDHDTPCGIVASTLDSENPATAGIFSMWIAPTHRRCGIGQLLINGIIDWARSRQVKNLRLNVTSSNDAALRFYEHLGFIKTGKTEPYPNDPNLIEFELSQSI